MTKRTVYCAIGIFAAIATVSACALLRGALNEACDPPHSVSGATQDSNARRMANCQPAGSLCCRRSANAKATLCSYPEDCYFAPYKGACVTPVDCPDGMDCTSGSCICPGDAPLCTTQQGSVCCALGEMCVSGNCVAGDGGITVSSQADLSVLPGLDL